MEQEKIMNIYEKPELDVIVLEQELSVLVGGSDLGFGEEF